MSESDLQLKRIADALSRIATFAAILTGGVAGVFIGNFMATVFR